MKIPKEIENYSLQLPTVEKIIGSLLGFMTDNDGNVTLPLSSVLDFLDAYAKAGYNDGQYKMYMSFMHEFDKISDEHSNGETTDND